MTGHKMQESTIYQFLPVLLWGLAVPLSMFMWIGNVAYSKIASDGSTDSIIPPTRWLFSVLVPLLLMVYGLRRKGVNRSGAAFGLACAVILSIASHAFLACLAAFFFSSSRATKFRGHAKRKFEEDFKEGGQRNWAQVICNAGMATQLALLYLLDCGYGERPIDFVNLYRSSWLGVAVMGSFACCNGDTWASELGTVIGSGDPILITSRKRVPRGTNGAVSLVGLVASFLGGTLIGLVYFLTVRYTVEANVYQNSPNQWPLIVFGGIAGLLGSLVDSLLGATLQYSGVNERGHIVERPGKNVRHISGVRILDNHSVNLISTIVTGIMMPSIAMNLWPMF
ncbi:transmembrane protein 19 [Anopheles arabiensis]|uniref:Transmembrane protein 19 n=1 Tax=Anopheles arabiensis TaxID=7173 RepID=A0A182HQ12_ANOAR|nr:transmembrane protein 19 [Anopheles arabiensis]XP_040169557.1 transmembrane protein 19 [Anopheles arabiensis]